MALGHAFDPSKIGRPGEVSMLVRKGVECLPRQRDCARLFGALGGDAAAATACQLAA
jgi:hypothetical protein